MLPQPIYQTGLVLSGGAAKGYAHLGALTALYEAGFSFDAVSGSSVGAIIGALLADGRHPAEIKEIFDAEKNFSLVKFKWKAPGLLSSSGLRAAIKRHLRAKTFEELQKPLWVAATDLGNGRTHFFNAGELLNPLLASSAIPLLFEPIKYQDRQYVDGGLTNNLPAEVLRPYCHRLLGINVNPVGETGEVAGWMAGIERVLNIAVHNNVAPQIKMLDAYIEPEGMAAFHLFSLDKGQEMFQMGYESATLALQQADQSLLKAIKNPAEAGFKGSGLSNAG
jgi:NTE family protein